MAGAILYETSGALGRGAFFPPLPPLAAALPPPVWAAMASLRRSGSFFLAFLPLPPLRPDRRGMDSIPMRANHGTG